jgi:hypothetical protein
MALRALAAAVLVLALAAVPSPAAEPLSPSLQSQLKARGFWHRGCPVGLSDLRVLGVPYWGFDGRRHRGHLIVNRTATAPLTRVFRKLYGLHFPIRHLDIRSVYGPASGRPRDGDWSGSFECRQAVPSPCTGGTGTGTWSMHAYGLAVDINPVENPYVGCGMSRDPAARRYRRRTPHRRGMVTRRAIAAFASVGWGWGGGWTGNTKDYMHFSSTGH